MGQEARLFRQGERVVLLLVLTNRGTAARQVQCGSARTHDASVSTQDGRELWRWSHGRLFAQRLTEIRLEAGKSREFRIDWDQTTSDGDAVQPGEYEAAAWIAALGARLPAQPVRFRIR